MKAGPECFGCLQKLSRQAIGLAAGDPEVKAELERRIAEVLEKFSPEVVPPDLSNEFHRIIKEVSGNLNPYREMKQGEMEAARAASPKLKLKNELRPCVEVAARGNAIDFFVDEETLVKDLAVPPRFAIDDIGKFGRKLEGAEEVLYLADNAGEVYFDLPLLDYLSARTKVTYAVKAEPIQNDLSMEDLREAGLELPCEVVAGPVTIGVYLDRATPEFRERFSQAQLVVAKGMGNFETLTELPQEGRFFYIFKAKCPPVARALGVEMGEHVAMLR